MRCERRREGGKTKTGGYRMQQREEKKTGRIAWLNTSEPVSKTSLASVGVLFLRKEGL
jgi:hypothetical protein